MVGVDGVSSSAASYSIEELPSSNFAEPESAFDAILFIAPGILLPHRVRGLAERRRTPNCGT